MNPLFSTHHPAHLYSRFAIDALSLLMVCLTVGASVYWLSGTQGWSEPWKVLFGALVTIGCVLSAQFKQKETLECSRRASLVLLAALMSFFGLWGIVKVFFVGHDAHFLLGFIILACTGPCVFIRFLSEIAYPKYAKHPKYLDELAKNPERRLRQAQEF